MFIRLDSPDGCDTSQSICENHHPLCSPLKKGSTFSNEQGYVITKIAMDEGVRQRAIDRVWELLPPRFGPDRRGTWKGIVQDSCHNKDLGSRRGRLKFRECVRKETWIYDLLAGHPQAVEAVEDLLGAGKVAVPRYFRGLYPVFPSDPTREKVEAGHLDTHPFQVGAVLYLDEVLPGGGGFHVWPGSYLAIALAYHSFHADDPAPDCGSILHRIQQETVPVEVTGPAGTLILWHQRLVHAAGLNRSRRVR